MRRTVRDTARHGWVERLAAVECPALTARRAQRSAHAGTPLEPLVWSRAEGFHVWDVTGRRFVDWTAGFGVAAVGHRHPRVLEAVVAQSGRLWHALGDLHPADRKVELLERLGALAPFDAPRGILGLSGSDAVTAALKTAVLATGKPGVLAFEGGYHGLSYGPLAACGYKESFRAPFAEQLNPHVRFAPWPEPERDAREAIDRVLRCWDEKGAAPIGAVLVEPIQGRGGVRMPPEGFLQRLSALARERGALLIADEIFTGLGRTGTWWRCETEGFVPDVLCVGKALGGGLPVSACLAPEPIMRAWGEPGGEALHTGTFFGHPLGCAAALATLQVLQEEDLPSRAARVGAVLGEGLHRIARTFGLRARGAGLLWGLEGNEAGFGLRLVAALREAGHLALPAGATARVLQFVPPLTVEAHAIFHLLDVLERTVPAVLEAGEGTK